jgi:putative oxidoreductase
VREDYRTGERRASVLWSGLSAYGDWALLALRLMVGVVFFWSGLSHAREPKKRGDSIGVGAGAALFLGVAEMAGALGVAFGVLIQPAAIGLILVMLGAIQRKIFVWKTGFWGEKASGWHYDLMLIAMNLVLATIGGGRFVLG